MIAYCLELSWPSADLSPNARCHWARKAKAVKAARLNSWAALRHSAPLLRVPAGAVVELEFVFIPPNLRRFDDDGLAARMKAARDGIADALGCDDHCFRQTHRLSTVPTPGGKVLVKLRVVECVF